MDVSSTVALLLAIPILTLAVLDAKRRRTRQFMPPGPPGHWLLGNKFPKTDVPRTFEKWTREYGPMYTLQKGFSEYVVVIGDYEIALDIMEKEGASVADRPRQVAAGEIVSGDMRTLILRQSTKLNRFRKALHAALQPKVVTNYIPIQEKNAHQMIRNILDNPDEHQEHAAGYAANTIIEVAYGHSALKLAPKNSTPEGNSLSQVIKQVRICLTRFVTAVQPGFYLVDSFPFLAKLPSWMYPPIKELREWHRDEMNLFRGMVNGVRNAREVDANGHFTGNYKEGHDDVAKSFTAYCLEKQPGLSISDDELAYLAGSMFGAGSDTTSGAISFVVMAAALNPDMQAMVRSQIDTVVGKLRAPNADDEAALPYVVAFVLESYRCWPVSVGGFAHKVTKPISYKEYVIPTGTSIIANHWVIGRCSSLFPDSEKFDIHRWLVPSSRDSKEMIVRSDIKIWNFGFGRRICPGLHFANRSLFLNTSLLMWAFDISQNPSHPIDPMAFTMSANMRPLPFKVDFKPRMPVDDIRRMLSQSF